MHQLHRPRRAHQALLAPDRARRPARGLRRQQHEQRPQALAAGRDRGARVTRQRLARARGHPLEVQLGARHALAQQGPTAAHDRLHAVHARRGTARGRARDRAHDARPAGTVPTWIAMMLPAISTARTSPRPARRISAASAAGAGKRLTELGR